ncbi:hypothetical protein CAL7716_012240 [Calothrix sp. PCC 7716]|nr:hypothetical protein CAL7716_012240 [Calothrix sp. PCC 7716]
MKKITNLYFCFLLSQFLFFAAPFFYVPLFDNNFSLQSSVIAHFFGLAFFTLGYFFSVKKIKGTLLVANKMNNDDKIYVFKNPFFVVSYLLMTFGLFVSILQVALFKNPLDYIHELLINREFNVNIRNDFLTESKDGGLSGVLKMFGFAPLSIYLFSFAILQFINISSLDKKKWKRLNFVALIMTIIRTLFSLERITIVAILLANLFIFLRFSFLKNSKSAYISLIWILLALLLAGFISSSRLEGGGITEFIFLYYKLGLTNLQLVIDTADGYTYGFSSIFSPLKFIFSFLNFTIDLPSPNYDWQWNPAQYLIGALYLDFGPFYIFVLFIIGKLCRLIDDKALIEKKIHYVSIYFIVMYCIFSFAGVPLSNGIDFWFSLIVPIILINRFAKRVAKVETL